MTDDDFNEDQRRNIVAAHGEERQRLIDRYRRRNQKSGNEPMKPGLGPPVLSPSRNPSGRYGPGTGRGEVPSRQRIRAADKGPTLLEQLRRDGSA